MTACVLAAGCSAAARPGPAAPFVMWPGILLTNPADFAGLNEE